MRHPLLRSLVFVFFVVALLSGCKTSGNSKNVTYKVRIEKGDTLSALAIKYDTTWRKIAKLNRLGSRPTINSGQLILIKPGPGGLRASDQISQPVSDLNSDTVDEKAKKKRRGFLFGGAESAWVWPVQGTVTSEFGRRRGRMHSGIDIGARTGVPIKAANSGTVIFAGWKRGYGRTVVIDHGSHKTLYAHCSKLQVKKRQTVKSGQQIAKVGRSGNATGSHLHFEYRTKNDKALNPRRILSTQGLSSL